MATDLPSDAQSDDNPSPPQRFCILLHDHPYWHWDFLLENTDHALCWRLLRQPCAEEPIAAQKLPPHRLIYLDYEGPVSNQRGTVKQIACGRYQVVSLSPVFSIRLEGLTWAQFASLDESNTDRVFWRFSGTSQL